MGWRMFVRLDEAVKLWMKQQSTARAGMLTVTGTRQEHPMLDNGG